MGKAKPYEISKHSVMEAFRRVKANAGGAGIDEQSIAEFELELKDNLYKVWNRMSSGSYFPPPFRACAIPKKKRWGENPRYSHGIGSRCADSRQDAS